MRADGTKDRDVVDEGESCNVDILEDIELALVQMTSETLAKVNEALRRLDETASSVARRSPRRGYARSRSRSAVRTARRHSRRLGSSDSLAPRGGQSARLLDVSN